MKENELFIVGNSNGTTIQMEEAEEWKFTLKEHIQVGQEKLLTSTRDFMGTKIQSTFAPSWWSMLKSGAPKPFQLVNKLQIIWHILEYLWWLTWIKLGQVHLCSNTNTIGAMMLMVSVVWSQG